MAKSSLPIKAVELRNITKTFGSVVANKDINLDLYKGEILSILGENGSGKTTAMNVLAGIYAPDEGHIYINGEEATINSPRDSLMLGIGMVHQHFKLVDVFTATENVVLGLNKKDFERLGLNTRYNKKDIAKQIQAMCEKYGFDLDPNKKVYNMSVSEKQTLEIVKTIYRGAEILILDEPTAVLTPQEIKKLFAVIKNMKADGKSIVIITHKLNEVMEVSDRVAIFRKGEHIATVETKKTNEKELTDMMVGKKINLEITRSEPHNPVDRLFIEHLTVKKSDGRIAVKDVSFVAKSGEILGIAGISGSGQRELLEAIQGIRPIDEGEVIFHNPKENQPVTFYHKTLKRIKQLAALDTFHYPDGSRVDLHGKSNKEIKQLVNDEQILFDKDEIVSLKGKNPKQIRGMGIRLSFVPEDRLGMGLVGSMSLTDNTLLRSYRHGHWVFLDRDRPQKLAEKIIDELNVSTPNTNIAVSKLSGGNIQKVLVGREIALVPKVFMAA